MRMAGRVSDWVRAQIRRKINLNLAESMMGRYLPGAILAVFGILVYVIGCAMFVAYRRQRAQAAPEAQGSSNQSLFIYATVMMVLGIAALGGGLVALEMAQYRAGVQ
jgi:uncharacterized membrane protein YidH (DUF202 family)